MLVGLALFQEEGKKKKKKQANFIPYLGRSRRKLLPSSIN